MKRKMYWLATGLLLSLGGFWAAQRFNLHPTRQVGQPIDSLNGVAVYYNGGVGHVAGRNVAPNGYNLGLKYQCVEFVKRYYFEHLHHQMPNSYGHAKDFFDPKVPSGHLNQGRNLRQYAHPGSVKPQPNDLLVFAPTLLNRYGHVAIVARVEANELEVVQQNPGPFRPAREVFTLRQQNGQWIIGETRIVGWLRKP
ncbi:MAG: CHAP domain-containing protein [Bernardetiaceae bacterium]|nr:CHAP domain-containing protein [Bernardetiaceae bacterium]